ncbi:hypothetical protein [Campylobacter concisus]|jgi:hypothetical protein|uniref:hypothetical protein n=1 Tax=Campylobacter concisus TaxID=199 RepID=UPI000CD982BD|nr:hypothetical protein [Campylobacter concisus]
MELTIENYLKHNERITPIQYVKAGQVIKSLTISISCKEHLNKFADIVDYSVDRYSPDGCASVIAKFKKDCLLVFEEGIRQLMSKPYTASIEYILCEVIEAFEVERRTNERHI